MIKEQRKRRILALTMMVAASMMICCCKRDDGDVIEVGGTQIQSTTEKEVISTEQIMSEESTVTTTQGMQSETESTTSEPPAPNYIYDKVGSDAENLMTAGIVGVSLDELHLLEQLLNQCDFNISIKAVSVDGSRCISYNSDKEYFAASTIKAPYLLYCYKQIDAGNGTFDETMVYTSNYYRGGTGDIKDSVEGTSYTLKEIMRRTIWNSDNSGYLMCTERWGKDGYNALMEQIGVDRLRLSEKSIWAFDVRVDDYVIVWKNIYDYFLTETEGANVFYESTTNCKWNFFGQGIKKCTIAQKYGWADASFSNAGIVYGENETYILAVFTDAEGDNDDKKLYGEIVGEIHKLMDK